MKKILLLPLDERPCNAAFPGKLFSGPNVQIITPDTLGDKKQPADWEQLAAFLRAASPNADGLVLSMDMLLYGGLLPSRIHSLDAKTVEARMELVRELKAAHPNLKIYAFQCIMRCPAYSSSDEEPDYYADCGEAIHKTGIALHRRMLGLDAEDIFVPEEALRDYQNRRAFNLRFNLRTLELVQERIIDFLVIPQDDSAPYGFTAMDQQTIREGIAALRLQPWVLMYPGADEVGLTLISRMLLDGRKPKVFPRYAAQEAPRVIPAYEDRSLGETVKAHILAAGCRLAESPAEADFILGLSCPGGKMEEAAAQPVRNAAYCVERNLTEFVLALQDYLADGKRVILCDNAYANGADLELMSLLDRLNLLDRLSGYAGWNTSANSLGTALAEGVYALLNGQPNRDFLALRYVEDALYCAAIRREVTENDLPTLNMDYFNVREPEGPVSRLVHQKLTTRLQSTLPSIADQIKITHVRMPWRRMFEVDLTVCWENGPQ